MIALALLDRHDGNRPATPGTIRSLPWATAPTVRRGSFAKDRKVQPEIALRKY